MSWHTMEYESTSASPFAPVKSRPLTPAEVRRENDALLAFKRSLAAPGEEVQTPARRRDEQKRVGWTIDPSRGQSSSSNLAMAMSRLPVLPAPSALPAPTQTSRGEDLDALLSNLQNDSEVLTIAIRQYEGLINRRKRFSASKILIGVAILIIGLAAGGIVRGLLFPLPLAPPPSAPPPSVPPPTGPPPTAPPVPLPVPPPSDPSTVLAKLPLVGAGTSLELLGTEPVHSWRSELAKLGLLGLLAALLALAASVGCHIASGASAHRSEQAVSSMASSLDAKRITSATGSTQSSQTTPKAENNNSRQQAAAATAARAAAARAAAANSLVQTLVTRTWERAVRSERAPAPCTSPTSQKRWDDWFGVWVVPPRPQNPTEDCMLPGSTKRRGRAAAEKAREKQRRNEQAAEEKAAVAERAAAHAEAEETAQIAAEQARVDAEPPAKKETEEEEALVVAEEEATRSTPPKMQAARIAAAIAVAGGEERTKLSNETERVLRRLTSTGSDPRRRQSLGQDVDSMALSDSMALNDSGAILFSTVGPVRVKIAEWVEDLFDLPRVVAKSTLLLRRDHSLESDVVGKLPAGCYAYELETREIEPGLVRMLVAASTASPLGWVTAKKGGAELLMRARPSLRPASQLRRRQEQQMSFYTSLQTDYTMALPGGGAVDGSAE